jgi:hypothetical protein
MSIVLLKTIRAITTVTLIGGSMVVQHVARMPQPGNKPADLQIAGGIGSDLTAYIIESRRPLLTLVR